MKVKLKDSPQDPVRLSFNDLFVPTAHPSSPDKFRYNATVLVQPGGANDKAIRAAILGEAQVALTTGAQAFLKSIAGNNNKICYYSGEGSKYEDYQGMMVLSAHRQQKDGPPGVFSNEADKEGKPRRLSLTEGKPYSGCYVNLSVDIWYQKPPNTGMRCGLVGVQFSRDGDSFSGATAASDDEFDVGEGAQAGSSLVGDDDVAF